MESALNSTPAADFSLTLLGPYLSLDTDGEDSKVQNTVSDPPPFFRILLERYLSPIQSRNRLCIAIIRVGIANGYKDLLDWMWFALVFIRPQAL